MRFGLLTHVGCRQPPERDAWTDARLLERFVASNDGVAFAALVRRHGPMVLRLCQRTLGQGADAADAF